MNFQKEAQIVPEHTKNSLQDRQRPVQQKAKTIALVAICLGYFMTILDTTIVNVATVNIQQQLGATVVGLQWVLDGYGLAFAGFLLTGGALGDRLGAKRVFLAGLGLFTLASVICGAAPTLFVLQIARALQGAGAALMVPASLSLLNTTYPGQRERARAVGIWGGIAGIGAVTGPVIGGFLVYTLSWRSIFFVNLPIGIIAIGLTWYFVASPPRLQQRGLDLAAQFATVIALCALTLALIEGESWGWRSLPILGAFALFIVAAIVFIAIERYTKSPMMPLSLFARPQFSAANTVGLLLNFAFYGQLFFINLFFQQVLGYSSLLSGLALVPESILLMISSPLSGRVAGRYGPRLPMVIGLSLGCLGFLAMFLVGVHTSYGLIGGMLAAIGFGTAFTMPAMTTAVIEAVPGERAGIASAILNACRQVGSVLGVALLGSLVSNKSTFIPGMHVAVLIAAGAFLVGAILSLLWVEHRGESPRTRKETPLVVE